MSPEVMAVGLFVWGLAWGALQAAILFGGSGWWAAALFAFANCATVIKIYTYYTSRSSATPTSTRTPHQT